MYKRQAYRDHTYETLDHVDTFADGIAVKTPGETTFKMIEQYVDGIVTVSEDEIAAAILALMEKAETVDELISTIHSHPTVSESVRECALNVQKRAIHIKN